MSAALSQLVAACVLLLSTCSWADSYSLFDPVTGQQVEDYDTIISRLQPGDRVQFANGKSFEIKKQLGSGNTTVVFELTDQPGRAIRLPKKAGYFRPEDKLKYTDLITHFNSGSKLLKQTGVAAIAVRDSLDGQYAIVDLINIQMTAERFFYDRSLPQNLRTKMSSKFVEFARSTAHLDLIGDLHPGQVVYDIDADRWILLDWTGTHSQVNFNEKRLVKKASSIFVRRVTETGERYDFFSEYATRIEDSSGIRWLPKDKRYDWVAKLANRSQRAIVNERLRIFDAQIAPCTSTFGRFLK